MLTKLFILFLASAVTCAEIQKFSDAKVKDLDNKEVSLSKYEGKCVLVINTASKCGFTKPNMKYLNKLRETHPDLAIVAFPSNSFGQEPKTNPQLKEWFFDEWKATYDVYAPADVNEDPVYKFLIERAGGRAVIWNYGKYVIEKDGKTVERYGPQAGAIFSSGLNEHLDRCIKA